MYGVLQWVRSRVVCVWGCSCIQSLEAAASETHVDHCWANVQRVSHLQVGIVPLLTGCQRHSNLVARFQRRRNDSRRSRSGVQNDACVHGPWTRIVWTEHPFWQAVSAKTLHHRALSTRPASHGCFVHRRLFTTRVQGVGGCVCVCSQAPVRVIREHGPWHGCPKWV